MGVVKLIQIEKFLNKYRVDVRVVLKDMDAANITSRFIPTFAGMKREVR